MNRAAAAVLILVLAACAHLRWSYHPRAASEPGEVVYYMDLGPDAVDVSSYPPEIRTDYAVFRRVCGECHTPARALNSPVQSRTYWRFHLARMSLHRRARGHGRIARADASAALDFLAYDSRVRKVGRAPEFEARTAELKRRFDEELQAHLQRLYESGAVEEP
jgi:hypothetical protein